MAISEELIDQIVDDLKTSPHKESDIHAVVCSQVDVLRKAISGEPSFGRRAENREYARRVGSLARKLERKLVGAPEGTWRAILALAACARRPQIPHPFEIATSDTIEKYERAVLAVLQDLQIGCAWIVDSKKVGDYHTLDQIQKSCAASALDLMLGLDAGQPTNGDPLRSIAGWLFEIVAPEAAKNKKGENEKDDRLRRSCEKVLADWRVGGEPHRQWLKETFARIIAQKSASSALSVASD